jgi:hypothetical protein
MTKELELRLLAEIETLKQEIKVLKGNNLEQKPTYQYSKIREFDLDSLVNIERSLNHEVFKKWFEFSTSIDDATDALFVELIKENELLMDSYSEEDLKVNFIVPLLNKVHFKSFEHNIRDFYELPLRYETDNFIFTGTTDFVVSSGLIKSKTPYFFIQKFKRNEEYGNPRPQLLAELISAVELNNWQFIKGAYIIGSMWYFVILEKLAKQDYRYYVSTHFDSMRLDDLKAIYQCLLFVKQEIIALDI